MSEERAPYNVTQPEPLPTEDPTGRTCEALMQPEANEALTLWREWLAKGGDPFYASEMGGDVYCFFCGEWQHDSDNRPEHEADCIYVRAKRLVEGD